MSARRLLALELVIGWGVACGVLWVTGQILLGWTLYGGTALGFLIAALGNQVKA